MFLGGPYALLNFLQNNIKYPSLARENGVNGKIVISFWIDKEGKVIDAKVIKSAGYGMDEEALRVINLMNETEIWIPGIYMGQNVVTNYVLPITFKLG
jgi:protein TonB